MKTLAIAALFAALASPVLAQQKAEDHSVISNALRLRGKRISIG